MVCLSVILLCYRITCLQFCNKKRGVICARPCIWWSWRLFYIQLFQDNLLKTYPSHTRPPSHLCEKPSDHVHTVRFLGSTGPWTYLSIFTSILYYPDCCSFTVAVLPLQISSCFFKIVLVIVGSLQ